MRGLVPRIHVFLLRGSKDVDGRVKPGHDEEMAALARRILGCDSLRSKRALRCQQEE
jgi:hypothetical protein